MIKKKRRLYGQFYNHFKKVKSMKLVFATNNPHKLEEVKAVIDPNVFELVSLTDIGFEGDIEEPGATLEENALIKSSYIYERYRLNCFGDDSGLEIDALNGEPGVYSARYSGERSHDKNIALVLQKLQGKQNRKARFRTVISLIFDDAEHLFEGSVEGNITTEKAGSGGFGYDPIFIPNGYNKTFAELSNNEKNNISHRAIAVKKLTNFLLKV